MKERILSFFLAGIMACSMVPAETFAASADVGDTTGTRMEAPELAGQSLPDGDGSAAECCGRQDAEGHAHGGAADCDGFAG